MSIVKHLTYLDDIHTVTSIHVEQSIIHCNVSHSFLEDYNQMSKAPMALVMFKFIIEHISRISRVLKQDNGHVLLIGQSPIL